jgi:hypothetical protein
MVLMLGPDRAVAGWFADNEGCQIWLKYEAVASIEWQGTCLLGRAKGAGRLVVVLGSTGQANDTELICECMATDGRVVGSGSVTGPDFGRYDGLLSDGVPQGLGIRVYKGGERYEGAWREGRRHGEGVVVSPRGWRYRGGFSDDLFSGQGRSEWQNGDWHEGAYLAGMRHGQGKYESKSGGWRFDGAFVKGVREGRGVLVLETGHTFSGEFKNGKPNGKGVCHDPSTRRDGACRYRLGRFKEWLE